MPPPSADSLRRKDAFTKALKSMLKMHLEETTKEILDAHYIGKTSIRHRFPFVFQCDPKDETRFRTNLLAYYAKKMTTDGYTISIDVGNSTTPSYATVSWKTEEQADYSDYLSQFTTSSRKQKPLT